MKRVFHILRVTSFIYFFHCINFIFPLQCDVFYNISPPCTPFKISSKAPVIWHWIAEYQSKTKLPPAIHSFLLTVKPLQQKTPPHYRHWRKLRTHMKIPNIFFLKCQYSKRYIYYSWPFKQKARSPFGYTSYSPTADKTMQK